MLILNTKKKLFFLALLFTITQGLNTNCTNNLIFQDGVCQCPIGLFLYNNNCTDTCPTAFYPDSEHNQCVPCARGCSNCVNNTYEGCSACFSGYNVQNGVCMCTYLDYNEMEIEAECPVDSSVQYINLTHKYCMTCVGYCPSGKYFDSSQARCMSCPKNCTTCLKSTNLTCVQCAGYYDLTSGDCIDKCNDVILGSTTCAPSSCSGRTVWDPSTGSCVNACPVPNSFLDIRYGGNDVCGVCDSTCLSSSAGCIISGDPKSCSTGCSVGVEVVRSMSWIPSMEITKTTYDCIPAADFAAMTNLFTPVTVARAGPYYYCSPECVTCGGNTYDCNSCSTGYEMYPDKSCRLSCAAPKVKIGDYCLLNITLQYLMSISNNTNYTGTLNNTVANVTTWLQKASKTSATVTNVARVTVSTFVLASQILNPGISIASTRTQSLNMLLYLRYLNIDYPTDLSNKFNDSEPSTYQIDFSFPENLLSDSDEFDPPYRYSRYGLSALFLVNFWGNIISLAIILGITVPLAFIQKKFTFKNTFIVKPLKWVTDIFVWNYIISFFFSSISDLFFFILVQFQSYPGPYGGVNVAGMVFSCIITIAIFTIVPIALIRQYRQLNQAFQKEDNDKVAEDMGYCKVLFEDFKHDKKMQLYFMAIYAIRVTLFSLFLAVIPQNPLGQAVILSILNGLMSIYLIYYRPFEDWVDNSEVIFYEIGLFITNVMTACLADCSTNGGCNDTRIESLSGGVLTVNIIMTIGSLVYSANTMISTALEYIKYILKRRRVKVVPNNADKSSFNQINDEHDHSQFYPSKLDVDKAKTSTGSALIMESKIMDPPRENKEKVKAQIDNHEHEKLALNDPESMNDLIHKD